uniref:Guanylate cyclase n=2 Tax=Crassostrea virginica TaxID=6565 RepID=A0A8B8EV65_CRAVI|nr:uncharacterized protein LOC111136960 isoform X1 [Crassostrea virginica]XP_022343863.1 uncharacterized protein LOC111136960 isoform X1 [Crassostrea virginica]XP_022343864.1 uncharacterized protein LOC111136960 isoform X1 [Crassostrea virginica]
MLTIPFFNGELRADHLYHQHQSDMVPPIDRVYVITAAVNGTDLSLVSETFEISTPAKLLAFSQSPPSTVVANKNFNVSVEIWNGGNNTITSGLDSTLMMTLQVAYFKGLVEHFSSVPLEDMVSKLDVRLAGDHVIQSKATYDFVHNERAVAGQASFTGLRLLDVHSCVKLNITMKMPGYPNSRLPNTYTDDALKFYYDIAGKKRAFVYNGTSDPAVLISDCINVTEQTLDKIIMISDPVKPKQGANFPIEPYIVLELQDADGRRIYSGRDSNLNITVHSSNSSACLSTDSSTVTAKDGRAVFIGSFCAPVSSIALSFTTQSKVSSSMVGGPTTTTFDVTDDVYLGNFIDYYSSGSTSDTGPNVDSFVWHALEDIKANHYPHLLPGRNLYINSYDTKNDEVTTTIQLNAMLREGEALPHKRVRGIIGLGSNTLTEKLAPVLLSNKIPQISSREDQYEFNDKGVYPYYSRLSWNLGSLSHSIMMAAAYRNWKQMLIVRQSNYRVNNILIQKAKDFGLEIVAEISVPFLPPPSYKPGLLQTYMDKIKSYGVRVIWMFMIPPLMALTLCEARDNNMTSFDGYQWGAIGQYGWYFPYENQYYKGCRDPNALPCSTAFKGWIGIDSTYDLKGTTTDHWKRVMERHLFTDRIQNNYRGTNKKNKWLEILAVYALAYDAVIVYSEAMTTLMGRNETITADNLVAEIRKVTIEGLTGNITFEASGDRPGFRGFMCVVNPHPMGTYAPASHTAVFARTFILENTDATSQLEIPMQAKRPLSLPPYNHVVANFTAPESSFMNKFEYNSSTGMISAFTQQIVPIPPETKAPEMEVKEDYTIAPFYCSGGCGGKNTDKFDVTKYEFGKCISMDKCECNDGYYGDNCEKMVCTCLNGHCKIPKKCTCDPGWLGDRCQNAICSACVNGRCTSPDICTCDSSYTGAACDTSLVVAIVVPIVVISIAIVIAVFVGRWMLKRIHLKNALQNLDWLVKFDEVMIGDARALSFVSTAGEDLAISNKSNICTWRSQKCYMQKFNCDSLSVESEDLRFEIIKMKETRHNNLIQFIGACLDFPNVCVLTEVAPKGSIEDLLLNDSVKLGWDFRFSLMKDICRGMEFLHRSDIGSHGRLKSSNCVVDNRWTCKITGFGLPTLRYDGPRRYYGDSHEPKLSNMFWTAPELIPGCKDLDDVKCGTKAGDVFSFAILMVEMCTREEPYTKELSFMDPGQVLELIVNKDAPTAVEARKAWYRSGGDTSKPFRPEFDDSYLPEEYAARSGMRKLLAQCWNTKPDVRPTFRQTLDRLNEIFPVKGELIDNLVNMLEKYSSNLEAIVAERTRELVAEKARTELLISQMLPKKVAEDLKHGKTVEPEAFECVTIYFSDLVGFTAIARDSTPFQVVTLLNDLYTCFDAILDHYDVYKVETIGDAYMVVSGLPIRNGNLHAGEIATMSLELLSSVLTFKIRHMPEKFLQLRCGMHSGPCVAGVVGLKMPRYCLFGDTVNTASRMESSSVALRAHMSESTATILEELGGYHLECRGEREVKGKGIMKTYWLNGKDGYDKPLPGRDLAVSLSQHEFK